MSRGMKWMVGGLAFSLALNFIVIGMILAWTAAGTDRRHGPRDVDFSMEKMKEILEPPSREILKKAIKDNRRAVRELYRERWRARLAVTDALEQEPFDPAALEAAFAEAGDAELRLQMHMHGVMVEVAEALSPEERAKLADWGKQILRRDNRAENRPPGTPPGPPARPGQ